MKKSEIMAKVKKIRNQMKKAGGGLKVYIDYELATHNFKSPMTEEEICSKTNTFFCNGIKTNVKSATLVYSAYEGIISITPNKMNDEESYFNPNGIDFESDPDKWDNEIVRIWNLIKTF